MPNLSGINDDLLILSRKDSHCALSAGARLRNLTARAAGHLALLLLVVLSLPTTALSQTAKVDNDSSCPALAPFYPGVYFGSSEPPAEPSTETQQWQRLSDELVQLQPNCLRSSEYYALLGAAQLNSGALDLAGEALE